MKNPAWVDRLYEWTQEQSDPNRPPPKTYGKSFPKLIYFGGLFAIIAAFCVLGVYVALARNMMGEEFQYETLGLLLFVIILCAASKLIRAFFLILFSRNPVIEFCDEGVIFRQLSSLPIKSIF